MQTRSNRRTTAVSAPLAPGTPDAPKGDVAQPEEENAQSEAQHVAAGAGGSTALHVEELEDFVLKLDKAAATDGEVPAAMVEKLHDYAAQVRPLMQRTGSPAAKASPTAAAASAKKKKASRMPTPSARASCSSLMNAGGHVNRSIDAQIAAREALAQKRILCENREESLREGKMREMAKREERLRKAAERDERKAEKEEAARRAREEAERERAEMRRSTAAATETARREADARRLRAVHERVEARKSKMELRAAQKVIATAERADECHAMAARMSRSRRLEEEGKARRAAAHAALRERSELRRREKAETERVAMAEKAAERRESKLEAERDAAWKLVLEAKKKSAELLKDVIKNDISHTEVAAMGRS